LHRKVLRERLDEGCAQATLRRSGDDIWLSVPIVGHDKLPVRSVDLVADDNLTIWSIFVLLQGRYRHKALMCVLQILAGFPEVTVRARAATGWSV
jgi:hypothetical protein